MNIINNSYKQIVLQRPRWLRLFVFVFLGLISLLLWVFGMFFFATGEYVVLGIGVLLGSLFSGFGAYILIAQVKLTRVRFKRKYLLIPYWHNTVTIKILVAVIITVFIGIGIFSIVITPYKEDSKLLNNGSHITGWITEKYVQGGGYDGSDTYYVHYVFSPNGSEELKGSGRINIQNWDQLREGGSIKIVFDPEDPSHNVPVQVDRSVWEIYFATILASIAVFLIVLLVIFVLLPKIIRSVHKKYNARSTETFWQQLKTENEAMEDFWGNFTNSDTTD